MKITVQTHSKEFIVLMSKTNPAIAIKTITHSSSLLVFWVSQDGAVLDALDAHHKNLPKGDRSVLVDPNHKEYLRGRAALIGKVPYVVVYGVGEGGDLTRYQQALLQKSYTRILKAVYDKSGIDTKHTIFIREDGSTLHTQE